MIVKINNDDAATVKIAAQGFYMGFSSLVSVVQLASS